jgi:hypothetical protein
VLIAARILHGTHHKLRLSLRMHRSHSGESPSTGLDQWDRTVFASNDRTLDLARKLHLQIRSLLHDPTVLEAARDL